MVEKFKQLLTVTEKEKGEVSIFGAFKMDNFTDKWSLIISAPWINNSNKKDSFKYLFDKLNLLLTEDERSYVARIGIFEKTSYVAEQFLQFPAGKEFKEEQVNGFLIHEGYLFASDKNI